jgi:hypothetical protein
MAESGPAGAGARSELEILQIIPAPNHDAIYADTNWKDEDGGDCFLRYPIACWALVLDPRTGKRSVRGMDGNEGPALEFCDTDTAFAGYAATNQEPVDPVIHRALDLIDEARRRRAP